MSGQLAAWRPSAVIGATYFAQGLVAYLGALMLGVLAQLGTPLDEQVGILASGALPWLLKFVLALLLDLGPSWPTRARSALSLALLGGAAAGLLALARAWAPGVPSSLLALALVWLALNLALAMQDVLVDALALDLLAERRALAATSMGLGHALGFGLVGPWWIGGVAIREGIAPALELGGLALGMVALVPLVIWAPGRPTKASERPRELGPSQPRPAAAWILTIAFFGVGMLAMLGPNLTSAIAAEFLFGLLHWEFADYAATLLPIGALAGVIAALAGGPLVARLGAARAASLAAGSLGVIWLIFANLSSLWSQPWVIYSLAACEGALQAGLLVGLHALALQIAARSPLAVTSFVVAMAALNLPRVLGPLLAPSLVAQGWVASFAGCGAASLLAALALARVFARIPAGASPASGIH